MMTDRITNPRSVWEQQVYKLHGQRLTAVGKAGPLESSLEMFWYTIFIHVHIYITTQFFSPNKSLFFRWVVSIKYVSKKNKSPS